MDPTKLTILVIDDEPSVRDAIRVFLAKQYRVLSANDGPSGIRTARAVRPDLILLDLLLPGVGGVEICRALKSTHKTRDIAVIVLTGSSDDDLRAAALLAGADALVSKPFRPHEFAVRIEKLFQKVRGGGCVKTPGEIVLSQPVLECGNLQLDPNRLEVTIAETLVSFTVLEISLLSLFIQNVGVIFNRRKILDQVWNDKSVFDRVVDNHVLQLRKKLAGFDHEIVSIYGAGYGIRPRHE